MSEIIEVPLETNLETPEVEEALPTEIEETPKARAKGRPKGAKNKPKEKAAPTSRISTANKGINGT